MKRLKFLVLAIVAFSLFACDSQQASSEEGGTGFTNLGKKEAKELIMSSHNNMDFIILDVRTPEEYDRGHLKNAILINFYNPNFSHELDQLDKSKDYLVYCRSGGRSLNATKMMVEKGFTTVMNLKRGVGSGFPVRPVGGSNIPPGQNPMRLNLMGH